MKINLHLISKSTLVVLVSGLLVGCNDNLIHWQIGGNLAKHKILVESQELRDIKVCSDEYKNIGFPVHLNIKYDQNTYYGLLEGLCITVRAKTVKLEFASPSSGKMARGTFEILE